MKTGATGKSKANRIHHEKERSFLDSLVIKRKEAARQSGENGTNAEETVLVSGNQEQTFAVSRKKEKRLGRSGITFRESRNRKQGHNISELPPTPETRQP
jgi:hypothetical protein